MACSLFTNRAGGVKDMPSKFVLQSWKQISEYVGRTERTLQRWERDFGFPVHRPSGKLRSSVTALPQEIQEWTRGKLSLKQIRFTARLNQGKWPNVDTDNSHRSVGHFRQELVESRLRLSALVREQKTLREQLARTRAQQRMSLQKLKPMLHRKSS